MLRHWLIPSAVCFAVTVGVLVYQEQRRGDGFAEGLAIQPVHQETPKIVRHVVLFKFKTDAAPEDVRKVEKAFMALRDKLKQIADFEWGTDVSTEKLSKGFTHCFFVTFHDEKGRDDYLPSDAHQEFVTLVKPLLDDVLVVDYLPQR
jgi:signal transduction protein with GAF and PtsI domain